jgi:hypothetical protein
MAVSVSYIPIEKFNIDRVINVGEFGHVDNDANIN